MEPMLPSDLMNESVFEYWNPDPNPLCSPPLISSSDGQTIHTQILGSDPHAQSQDILNKHTDSPFTENWGKESPDGVQLTNHTSLPVWSENCEDDSQSLNLPISKDVQCLQTHLLSPAGANETSFLNALDKDSDTFLDNDILNTSDLYSPLKETSDFNDGDPANLMLTNDVNDNEETSHPSSLQEKHQDMWRAVGIVETRNEVKPITLHNMNQPQGEGLMQTNNFCPPDNAMHQSFQSKIHPQCLPKPTGHHFGSPTPLGWLHCSSQYPVKNHIRFRKSRCRKPLLRNFQSNFFRLPIQSKNKSPQLQMVKLFRSNLANGKGQTAEEEVCENVVLKPSDPSVEDNPELALMKTVDMPSGKRVEDIYVVPSVWITSKNCSGSDSMKTNSEIDLSPSMSHSPNSLGRSLGGNPLKQDHINYQGSDSTTCYNPRFSSFATPPAISPSHISAKATASSSPTEINWSEDGAKCGMKNLIITTLNAPKIDMIPCLKDLCKAVLNDHMTSLHKHLDTFSTQSTVLPPMNVNELSSESLVSENEKLELHQFHIKDAFDQSFVTNHSPVTLEDDFKSGGISLQMGNETSQPGQSVDLINSMSYHDVPMFSAINSPNDVRDHIDKEQMGFDQEENEADKSSLTLGYQDNPNTRPNIFEDDPLASLDAIINKTSNASNHVSSFSTTPPLMPVLNSNESLHSGYDNGNESLSEHAHTVSSLPEASSSSSFIDSPLPGDVDDVDTYNPPELVNLIRQIKELQVNDPINKPLANLSTTLHLLHDAEKTLCNSNFGVYQQLKLGQHPKFGQLIRCILSLTSTVVTMGKSLYEWTRSSTDHQCLKTVEILANLYQNNIINLIELITPYFHYLCGLIASCHSDILKLNKTKMLTETNPDKENSYVAMCPQQGMNEVHTDKTNSHYIAYNKYIGVMPSHDLQGFDDHDGSPSVNVCQRNTQCLQQANEFPKMLTTAQLAQKPRSPNFRNHPKKQKVSLLKHGMPMASKCSPYRKLAETRTSLTDVRYSSVKSDPSTSKTVLINVNPNKIYNGTRPSVVRHHTQVQPTSMCQNKLLYQTISSLDSSRNQNMPCVVSYRAPFQDSSKTHQTYIGGPKPSIN